MINNLKIGKHLFFGLVLLVLVTSCNKDEDHQPELNYLIDYQKLETISASSIQSTIILSQLDFPTDELVYDVTIYKVRYRTHYKENEIIASGLVAVPDVEATRGILSFQHGTIASDLEAPSNERAGTVNTPFRGAGARGIGITRALNQDFILVGQILNMVDTVQNVSKNHEMMFLRSDQLGTNKSQYASHYGLIAGNDEAAAAITMEDGSIIVAGTADFGSGVSMITLIKMNDEGLIKD